MPLVALFPCAGCIPGPFTVFSFPSFAEPLCLGFSDSHSWVPVLAALSHLGTASVSGTPVERQCQSDPLQGAVGVASSYNLGRPRKRQASGEHECSSHSVSSVARCSRYLQVNFMLFMSKSIPGNSKP